MFSARGKCVQGWKCRFLGAHVKVVGPSVKAVENAGTDGEQGSKEGQDEKEGGVGAGQMLGFQGTGLELLTDEKRWSEWQSRDRPLVRSEGDKERPKVVIDDELNFASGELQRALRTRKYPLPKTKIVLDYLEKESQRLQRESTDGSNAGKGPLPLDFSSIGKAGGEVVTEPTAATSIEEMDEDAIEEMENNLRNSVATKTEARREEGLLSCLSSSDCIDKARLRAPEKRRLNWKGELYLAPLTTTGNLPFRRLCVSLGCDITCGEMGLCESFLQGNGQEWSLIRRWEGERIFGTQVCGNKPSLMVPAAETIASEFGEGLDFVDINSGCPIDLVYNKGAGSALLDHASKLSRIMRGMNAVLGDVPLTIKLRTGTTAKQTTHKLFARLQTEWGASATTLHGRSRQQRYKNDADWGYIKTCADTLRESVRLYNEQGGGLDGEEMVPIPIYGNGDVYSWQDYYERLERTGVDGEMIARGALIKPWIFTEIKERRDWDISSRERLDLVREFASNGLTHWGSDTQGVNTTRRFLCEMISFTHRYVPTGLLEQLPARINDRPPPFKGRDELETLLASGNSEDWVRISEMFLGKCPDDWKFTPKHKSNAYSDANEAQG
ncbi:FMN-linked oxidoreductase [Violaceomyces palustris]|uniref:FMN-linked oxidoreductase n=1 Tax=Violaceomyces palustris TaxID=1673888 RepID=A0ACD0NS77_9BASI|nr:FMN-linked oxidoreductase [Violaceomyces palustris]